ncbi:hypothetical protein ACF090_43605, partial [Streptomyces sp. NPDC014892]|uniref:hypothetical protein n=1 Tax=Streptomyces sp. NPDC014892 TaxID=3364930 RepID=UPI003702FFF3
MARPAPSPAAASRRLTVVADQTPDSPAWAGCNSSSPSIEDFHARIDDPDLDVDADSVLVLRGCGPKGY